MKTKCIITGLVIGVILFLCGSFLGCGSEDSALTNKVAAMETEIEQLKSKVATLETEIEQLRPVLPVIGEPEPGALTTLNMNEAAGKENTKIGRTFRIEWNEGPDKKVFQVYMGGELVKTETKNVMKGDTITLNKTIRGRCEFKTWWDDGTQGREEVWVNVSDK